MDTLRPVPSWGTIPRMLRDQAASHPGAEVVQGRSLSGQPVTLTLADLAGKAAEVARALLALGIETGDRVAIWAPNAPEWVVTAYGLWDAGAVVAPLSTRFKGIEAAELLRKTGARVLFVAEGFMGTSYLDLLADAGGGPAGDRPYAGLPDLEYVVAYGRPERARPGQAGRDRVLDWEAFLAGGTAVTPAEAEKRALSITGDDLGEIMATSGTTGTPKGVMLHHSQLLRGYWDWAEIVTLTEDDRYPIIAPFSHGFGINAGLLACVLKRATMMPIALFVPDELMDLIERERVSILAGAPAMFFKILDELDGGPGRGPRDVSSLRVLICGAAAVPPELIRNLVDRIGLERMINAYGLMEGTVVSMTRPEDPVEVIAGSTGRAVPGVTVRVVDDAGKDVPAGERGEILVGGYGVMRGYWKDPEKTAEAVDPEGWLRTGDIGTLDEHGNVAIVDRKKEMFIFNGFNGYPAEIEALLLHHPGLAQAAVVGMPDPKSGEAGWAYVVPKAGAEADPAEVIAWARENMSNYKVPRRVFVVDALPLNVNGKVDKPLLRRRAAET
ncbi:AMP-binding protein [Actinomadura scrupuli]|uniref:AMP-binding protein n=1 Tax=Actinomadura scrupuli TaxID=559629 RepID=UPI003D994D58